MSLISVVVTNDFVSLTGDGRGMSAGDKDEILSENIQKVYKLNDIVMVGFAGSDTVRESITNNIGFFNNENAKTFARTLFAEIGDGKINKYFFIIIGGLDELGNTYCALFEQSSSSLIELNPEINHYFAFCNSTDSTTPHNPQEMLQTLINEQYQIKKSLSIKDCKDIQERFNEIIKNIDKSVNLNIINNQIIKNDMLVD